MLTIPLSPSLPSSTGFVPNSHGQKCHMLSHLRPSICSQRVSRKRIEIPYLTEFHRKFQSQHKQRRRGNLGDHSPLQSGRGWGEGPLSLMFSFILSQNYTEEQNTQGFTETLSQPISQNDITKISRNALWYLSSLAGVCGFSLWAERLLFICENLWEIEFPTSYHQKTCPMTPTMAPGARNEN